PRARCARAADRDQLRALPQRQRAVEHARVPGLARHGRDRPAVAPARLDGGHRLDAGADVGLPRGAAERVRRRGLAGDRHVPRPGRRLHRARGRLLHRLRAPRTGAGDPLAHVTTNLRIFTLGGYYAYRALFNWQAPSIYIPTMLAHPVFQLLFFAYLGRFSGTRSDAFFVVGNGIQVCAMGSVYGMALTIGGERWTQTLGSLLATPANRAALFLGRAVPNVLNGLLVSAFAFLVGRLVLDCHPPASSVPSIALLVLLCTLTCCAFGMTVGALGLRFRDVFMIANPAYFLMLLLCGVNVPLDRLPGWMSTIGSGLPLTHGIAAARVVAVGAAWTVAAYVLLRVFEAEGRRRATLEVM